MPLDLRCICFTTPHVLTSNRGAYNCFVFWKWKRMGQSLFSDIVHRPLQNCLLTWLPYLWLAVSKQQKPTFTIDIECRPATSTRMCWFASQGCFVKVYVKGPTFKTYCRINTAQTSCPSIVFDHIQRSRWLPRQVHQPASHQCQINEILSSFQTDSMNMYCENHMTIVYKSNKVRAVPPDPAFCGMPGAACPCWTPWLSARGLVTRARKLGCHDTSGILKSMFHLKFPSPGFWHGTLLSETYYQPCWLHLSPLHALPKKLGHGEAPSCWRQTAGYIMKVYRLGE